MRSDRLTDKQHAVLEYIREHLRNWGTPPSRAAIADALGFAFHSAADSHLKSLERKGFIRLHKGRDHAMQLLREGAPILDADELPAVAAGNPSVAYDQPEPARLHSYDSVTAQFSQAPDWFVRIDGDSVNKLYQDGDVVAVKHNPDFPRNGDVVVARLGEAATVKVFHKVSESRIELRPASHNPDHQPIQITERTTDFEIVGVVVGAIVAARRESTE